MADERRQAIVQELLDRYGNQSLAELADIPVRSAPNNLFQLLMLAILLRPGTDPQMAGQIFQQLRDRKWTTAGHMRGTTEPERRTALSDLGLPEGDAERAAMMLGDAALHIQADHGSDLGRLRDEMDRDPERIRERLRWYAGIDDPVVDGFFREVQQLWPEVAPFADKKVLDAAGRLDLGTDAEDLAALTDSTQDLTRLEGALIRARHDDAYDDVIDAAENRRDQA